MWLCYQKGPNTRSTLVQSLDQTTEVFSDILYFWVLSEGLEMKKNAIYFEVH